MDWTSGGLTFKFFPGFLHYGFGFYPGLMGHAPDPIYPIILT